MRWDTHIHAILVKAQQRLFFLRQLKKFGLSKHILIRFYRAIIESIITFSITVWYGNATQKDRISLERIAKTASRIIGCEVPSDDSVYAGRLVRRSDTIIKDTTHPAHHFYELLPSGKCFFYTVSFQKQFKTVAFECSVLRLYFCVIILHFYQSFVILWCFCGVFFCI